MKKGTKSNFVLQFILAILKAGGELASVPFQVPYKGVRYIRTRQDGSWSDPVFRQGISNLKHRGIIKSKKDHIELTYKGRTWYRHTLLKHYEDSGIPWDKKWRVVLFDIPSEKNNARNIFRHKLKILGFLMMQKSVFVFPYPCEEEIAHICNELKIDSYVDIIITDFIGSQDDYARKVFHL